MQNRTFLPGIIQRLLILFICVSGFLNSLANDNIPYQGGFITSSLNQSIGYGTAPSQFTASSAIGGTCGGAYIYQWQSSADGSNFSDIFGATGLNYQSVALYTTTYFRRRTRCSGIDAYTDNIIMVTVAPPSFIPGFITPNTSYINYNRFIPGLTLSGTANGSCGGNYVYAWQYSTDGTNWSYLLGANGTIYPNDVIPRLTVTTYYRVEVSCSGETKYSDVAVVNVYPQIQGGSVSPSTQTVDYHANASQLSVSGVSGGIGTYTYQWRSSPNNSSWTDISGATGTTYTPTGLTATTYYKVDVNSNGAIVSSASAVVNVHLEPGSITPTSAAIDYNTSPGQLTGTSGAAGSCGGSYGYQWQSSSDGTNFSNISGATSQHYTPGNLTANTWFRRTVTCSGEVGYTNVCAIVVDANKNYVREREIIKPGVTNVTDAILLSDIKEVRQTTQYFDGLGRLDETVAKKASLSNGVFSDIVSFSTYDGFGRESLKYLPFASSTNDGLYKNNAITEQNNFYTSANSPVAGQGELFFYKKTNFEASPLNRINDTYAPGISWAGTESNPDPAQKRNVKMKYWVNTLTDDVKMWNVTDVTNALGTYALASPTSVYPAGTLYKSASVDEQGKQVIEFKGKEGKVILKKVQLTAAADDGNGSGYSGWLCTYYIYDDLNNLRCVIQPEGVKALSSPINNWDLNYSSGVLLNEQCFRYEYDGRNRMIMKKVPGIGIEYMVYDAKDRLVLTQDAKMNADHKWLFTQYDALSRPITKGSINDDLNYNNPSYHWTNASISTSYPDLANYSTNVIFTRTFYDDYNWVPTYGYLLSGTRYSSYDSYLMAASGNWPYPQAPTQSFQTKGMVTGTWVNILGTVYGLSTANIYDEKGRIIQTQSNNLMGGLDIVNTQYSWSGQPLLTIQKSEKVNGANPQTHVIITKYEYDDLGRSLIVKKTVSSTINGVAVNKPEQTIVQNEYDKLGQLKTKKLAPGFNNGAGIENLTYDYNIRGWMLGVNRNYLTTTGQNGVSKFGFELGYDKTTNNSGRNFTTGQYNGNITGMIWKSDGDDVKRKYDFSYDAANRLLQGLFEQDDAASSWNSTTMNYTSKMGDGINATSAYDDNGNIKAMTQYGWKLGVASSTPIDNLTYTMETGSNRLKQVTDANNDNLSKLGDFKYDPATKTSADYSYDVNGNLALDNNKNISSITYNHLNLPLVITVAGKGNITYTYDASGNKLQKVVTETGQPTRTTLYIGGAVYENDVLQFLSQEEGRIRFKPLNGAMPASFEYDYFIKDHLGNVRMVLTEEQQQDKYPVASLEDAKVATEGNYYTIDNTKIVLANTVTNLPSYTNDNGIGNNPSDPSFEQANSQKLYKLNSNTNKTGLGITLKVMAGDKIDILGKSYWFDNNTGGSAANVAPAVIDLLTGFMGAPGGATTGGHTTVSELNGISGVTSPVNSFIGNPGRDNPSYSQRPKAFINYLFFDEQFKYVNGGFSAVSNTSGLKSHFSELQNLAAQKNGYVYIYVSNESPVNVYFDNLQVVHTRGPILEETHYYPFGLTMAGISSKALNFGNPENKKKKFQGQEYNDDLGVDIYEFKYRMDDSQIGRFWQVDPLADKYVYNSTYAFSENHVTSHVELEGLEKAPVNDPDNITFGPRNNSNTVSKKQLEKGSYSTNNKPKVISDKIKIRLKVSGSFDVKAGAAIQVKGVGGGSGGVGLVFAGVKDNEFYFAGKNLNTGEQTKFESFGVSAFGVGSEEETTSVKRSDGTYEKVSESSTVRSLGVLTMTDEKNLKTGVRTETYSLSVGFASGLGLILNSEIKIPFYEKKIQE